MSNPDATLTAMTQKPNAIVEYEQEGRIVAADLFYDPGLDVESWYSREEKARRIWRGPHLAYGCGRPLPR